MIVMAKVVEMRLAVHRASATLAATPSAAFPQRVAPEVARTAPEAQAALMGR